MIKQKHVWCKQQTYDTLIMIKFVIQLMIQCMLQTMENNVTTNYQKIRYDKYMCDKNR